MPENTVFTVIEIALRQDSSGLYHVDSKDVAGLHLSGNDLESLCQQIEPAIKLLYKLNQNSDVTLRPVSEPAHLAKKIPAAYLPGTKCPSRLVAYA